MHPYDSSKTTATSDHSRPNREQSKMVIRNYRHPQDCSTIRDMFVSGTLHGEGAPYAEAMTHLTMYLVGACSLFTIGLCLTLYDEATKLQNGGVPFKFWRGRFVIGVSMLWMAYCCYYWYTTRRTFREFILQAVDDLKDPVQLYRLRPSQNDIGFEPSGPSGFWIADEGGEIVGFVGLIQRQDDPAVGLMSRLIVSPSYRRRGIGAMLTETVVAHACENGLKAIEVITSDLNRAALAVYEKNGWTVERRYKVKTLWLRDLRKRLA